jgi:peroxiredoxin
MPVDSETVPVGAQAPDFELTAIDGTQVKLSDLRGKPVVLVFLRGFM